MEEALSIAVGNIRLMVDLFFVRKVIPRKKQKQIKNLPGIDNI